MNFKNVDLRGSAFKVFTFLSIAKQGKTNINHNA